MCCCFQEISIVRLLIGATSKKEANLGKLFRDEQQKLQDFEEFCLGYLRVLREDVN